MKLRIRRVKNASGNISVQVVSRPNRSRKIIKHIGTARTQAELIILLEKAKKFIEDYYGLQPLPIENPVDIFNRIEIHKVYHHYAYEFLEKCYKKLKFDTIRNRLVKDLVIIRLIEPVSKIKSIELLAKHFDIHYTKNQLYKGLEEIIPLKNKAEKITVDYARKHLSFDFSLVFYDVTTLYFESFKEDETRKCGFSKDNKFNQPQILIALIVDQNGYPIGYEIFEGNKFEGHTMLPVILKFKKKFHIDTLTVVADAAMLSKSNMEELRKNSLRYVVGARLGNLPLKTIKKISRELNKVDQNIILLENEDDYLICDYSKQRASKDNSDREKQICRAKRLLANPNKILKKSKYLKNTSHNKLELNIELIKKSELLEGIKGYCTNIKEQSAELLIARYKDLWKIEKAFRIVKSDLKIRPVYHWKKTGIESHLIIVFICLSIAKFIELRSQLSINVVKDLIWDVHDVEFIDTKSNIKHIKRTSISEKLLELNAKLDLWH